jgi:hypothetical protein
MQLKPKNGSKDAYKEEVRGDLACKRRSCSSRCKSQHDIRVSNAAAYIQLTDLRDRR